MWGFIAKWGPRALAILGATGYGDQLKAWAKRKALELAAKIRQKGTDKIDAAIAQAQAAEAKAAAVEASVAGTVK